MVVSTELPPDERLEQLLWNRKNGNLKPWNIIIRSSSGPPSSCAAYATFDVPVPSREDPYRSLLDSILAQCVRTEIQRLLYNDPQKIIEITFDQHNQVYVYAPLSS